MDGDCGEFFMTMMGLVLESRVVYGTAVLVVDVVLRMFNAIYLIREDEHLKGAGHG